MIDKATKKKVAAAFNLLRQYDIHCYVVGCFDIHNADEAVAFADDKEEFYSKKG